MNKWLGWCVALLIHMGVTGALADDADRSIWILLRDKTDAEGRRIAWEDLGTGRQDAELDLLVSQSYLERLRSLGVEVRVCSRWLNAISAQVSPDVERRVLTQDFVREHAERMNADLPDAARIRRFLLLHKELDADDAELTRTRKVRRGFIAQRYNKLVSALYGEEPSVSVETEITYQDGRTSTTRTEIKVGTLGSTN